MAEKSNPNLSTSTTGSLDLSGDADMKMAKKVITALTTDIVAIIQHEISGILDLARSKGLIGEGMYSKYRREKHDPKEVAREFLEAVEGQFMMDSSKFDALLEIFESTPPLESISKRIREEIAAEAATSKECDSDVFSSHLSMSTSTSTLPAAGAVFDSPLPQDVAPQQIQSSEKIEFVTGNILAQRSNPEALESRSSNFRKFSTQAGYDDKSESVKHPEGGATEERATDHAISPVPSVVPYSFYQQAEIMIKKEKNKAQTFMQKSADALRQVTADLDFAPDFNSEVQDTSNNYQKYMIGVEKKEIEMEELKDNYEKKLEELTAKYKEKIRNKDEQAEKKGNKIEELKCEYEKSMEKLLEEIKQLQYQGNIRDSNFKIQTMTMTVESSKEVAKLKDEILNQTDVILNQTDVIAKLRDELNQNKLEEKDMEIRRLKEIVANLQQPDTKSAESARKRLMEATGEHSQ